LNRSVDQPFKYLGILAGRRVEQDRGQSHPARAADRPVVRGVRSGSFDVAIEGNCQEA
jgi:hypothetical protein